MADPVRTRAAPGVRSLSLHRGLRSAFISGEALLNTSSPDPRPPHLTEAAHLHAWPQLPEGASETIAPVQLVCRRPVPSTYRFMYLFLTPRHDRCFVPEVWDVWASVRLFPVSSVRPQPCAAADFLAISSRCIWYSPSPSPKSAGRVGRSGPGSGASGRCAPQCGLGWAEEAVARFSGGRGPRPAPKDGGAGLGARGRLRRGGGGGKGVCAELGRRCPAGAAPESGLSSAEGSGEEPREQTRRGAPRAAPRRARLAAPGRGCAACAGLARLNAQGWAGGEPRPRARGGARPPAACVGPARAATFWRHLEFRARGRTPAWG